MIRWKSVRGLILCVFWMTFAVGFPEALALARSSRPQTSHQKTSQIKSKSSHRKTKPRYYIVVAPETLVYDKPDLDAKPIAKLNQGARIAVSKGTQGSYAKFYRMKIKGRVGWVTTMDVRSETVVKKAQAQAAEDEAKKKNSRGKEEVDEEPVEESDASDKPFVFHQSLSLLGGVSNYQESVYGGHRKTSLTTFGVRILGPDVVLTGPIMDFGILVHTGVPDYYSTHSQSKPTGFWVWADALLIMPMMMHDSFWLGLGFGPVVTASRVQTIEDNREVDSFVGHMGVLLSTTAAVRIDRSFLLRIDLRYLWVGESYPQALFGFGTFF